MVLLEETQGRAIDFLLLELLGVQRAAWEGADEVEHLVDTPLLQRGVWVDDPCKVIVEVALSGGGGVVEWR